MNTDKTIFKKRVIDFFHDLRLRSELDEAYRSYVRETGGARLFKSILKTVSVAVIVFSAVGFAIYYHHTQKLTKEEKLFTCYYETLDKKVFFNFRTDFDEARDKYFHGDFKAAFAIYSKLPYSVDIKAEKDFFTGLSLMELGSYYMAIEKFKEVTNSKYEFAGHAYWYMGLCYIKTCQKEEALNVFKAIVDNKSYNYTKASKILRRLQ